MTIGIWEIVASNQLFIRCFYTEIKFSKKTFFVMGPFFSSHSICLNLRLAFDKADLYGNNALSIAVLSIKKATPLFQKRFSFFKKYASKSNH